MLFVYATAAVVLLLLFWFRAGALRHITLHGHASQFLLFRVQLFLRQAQVVLIKLRALGFTSADPTSRILVSLQLNILQGLILL